MKLMFTFQSHEDAKFQYSANVIRDDKLLVFKKPCYFWFGDAEVTQAADLGQPIDGDEIPFIFVPLQITSMTSEIVGGCLASVEYNGTTVPAVVGDFGPLTKLGGMSPAALTKLGIPDGLDTQEILFRIWPGTPAVLGLNSKIYRFELQPN